MIICLLSFGCVSIDVNGAKLSAFGKGKASMQEGDITTFFQSGMSGMEISKTECKAYIDQNGIEQPCRHYKIEGAEFSGWAITSSMAGLALQGFNAAK